MRPSSTNPFYRATTPTYIDFFEKERRAEQSASTSANQTPMLPPYSRAERAAQSVTGATPTAVTPSSTSNVTIDMVRQYLRETGHHGEYMENVTVLARLYETNVSTETLLTALQTAHNPNHPLWATLGAKKREREKVISKLTGIVINKSGFRAPIKNLLPTAHNDPNQLIACLLEYVRSLGD